MPFQKAITIEELWSGEMADFLSMGNPSCSLISTA
jgi:hypothetical protein